MYNPIANGQRLRDLRGSQSLQEVSTACGISVNALRLYEAGERNPRDEVKISLSNFYHVPAQIIFYPEEA